MSDNESAVADNLLTARSTFRSNVERVDRHSVSGWAFDPSEPDARIRIEVSANGRVIGRVLADRYRVDLEKAGIGDGLHGFLLVLPDTIATDIDYEIKILRESDGAQLRGSPAVLAPTEQSPTLPRVKTKADIINLLAWKYGLTTYLEISSATTGLRFGEIDREPLKLCHRIVYNCPSAFDDGQEVTWQSPDTHLDSILPQVFRAGFSYDLVLVDSFHTLTCSARDLSLARGLLSERGVIVMHDTAPPSVDVTVPEFIEGPWAGQSYVALVDFLLSHPEIGVYVVDVDWGVAVIGSQNAKPLNISSALSSAWRTLADNTEDRFGFFSTHRRELLNLVSIDEFRSLERLRVAETASRQFLELFPAGRTYDHDQRPDFLRDLARVHLLLGNATEGRRLLEAALAERSDAPYTRELLAKLP